MTKLVGFKHLIGPIATHFFGGRGYIGIVENKMETMENEMETSCRTHPVTMGLLNRRCLVEDGGFRVERLSVAS